MPNTYVALGEKQAASGNGRVISLVALLTGFGLGMLWFGGAGHQLTSPSTEPINEAALQLPRAGFKPQLRSMRAAPQFRNVRVNGEAVDALSPTSKEILDKLKTLTLLEAAALVSAIEEEFGVDASAPAGGAMMMAPMPGAGGDAAAPAAEEKTTFDVILEAVDEGKRVAALKIVRGITGLGLKETKDFMAALPKPVKEGAKKEECEELVKELEAAGAKATIK